MKKTWQQMETPERIQNIRDICVDLKARGVKITAGEIAHARGDVTRNAIVGFFRRHKDKIGFAFEGDNHMSHRPFGVPDLEWQETIRQRKAARESKRRTTGPVVRRLSTLSTFQRTAPPPPPPRLRVIVNEKLAIEDFIAKRGVRRFEQGLSSDFPSLWAFLKRRGYEVTQHRYFYTVKGHGRHLSRVIWQDVIDFVDELRISEGKEPILRRA